jgi:hypothetical protein
MAPVNDDVANAIAITAVPYSNVQSTVGATLGPGEPFAASIMQATVWYSITVATDTYVAMDLYHSDFDTVIAIWDSSLTTRLAYNDDGILEASYPERYGSYLQFGLKAGELYYIQIGGWNGETGILDLRIGPPGSGEPSTVFVSRRSSSSVPIFSAIDGSTYEVVGDAPYPGSEGRGIDVQDGFVYVGDVVADRLVISNAADPSNLQFVSKLDWETGNDLDGVDAVSVQGNYLYAAGHTQFWVIDVSDPSNPAIVSTIDHNGAVGTKGKLVASGSKVFIVDPYLENLRVIDVQDPSAPFFIGAGIAIGEDARGLAISPNGLRAYVGSWGRLTVVDISNPSSMSIVSTFNSSLLNGANHLAFHDYYIYVAVEGQYPSLQSSLVIVDVHGSSFSTSQNNSPVLQSSTLLGSSPLFAWDIAVAGNRAWITLFGTGVAVVNVYNVATPSLVTIIPLSGASHVHASDCVELFYPPVTCPTLVHASETDISYDDYSGTFSRGCNDRFVEVERAWTPNVNIPRTDPIFMKLWRLDRETKLRVLLDEVLLDVSTFGQAARTQGNGFAWDIAWLTEDIFVYIYQGNGWQTSWRYAFFDCSGDQITVGALTTVPNLATQYNHYVQATINTVVLDEDTVCFDWYVDYQDSANERRSYLTVIKRNGLNSTHTTHSLFATKGYGGNPPYMVAIGPNRIAVRTFIEVAGVGSTNWAKTITAYEVSADRTSISPIGTSSAEILNGNTEESRQAILDYLVPQYTILNHWVESGTPIIAYANGNKLVAVTELLVTIPATLKLPNNYRRFSIYETFDISFDPFSIMLTGRFTSAYPKDELLHQIRENWVGVYQFDGTSWQWALSDALDLRGDRLGSPQYIYEHDIYAVDRAECAVGYPEPFNGAAYVPTVILASLYNLKAEVHYPLGSPYDANSWSSDAPPINESFFHAQIQNPPRYPDTGEDWYYSFNVIELVPCLKAMAGLQRDSFFAFKDYSGS